MSFQPERLQPVGFDDMITMVTEQFEGGPVVGRYEIPQWNSGWRAGITIQGKSVQIDVVGGR